MRYNGTAMIWVSLVSAMEPLAIFTINTTRTELFSSTSFIKPHRGVGFK
jgi:hypothetical protein